MSEVTQETGNQTVESQAAERDADTEALFEQFGLPRQQQATKDVEFPNMDEPNEPPTTEEQEETDQKPSGLKLKIKYNGEEEELDEEEARKYAQMGKNYDKVQAKLAEQQKALDRAARLAGYENHSDYIANLDKLEQERAQAKEREFEALEQGLYDELVESGIDEDRARQYIENHPLLREAKALKETQQQQTQSQQLTSKWQALYDKYPHLVEDAQAFTRNETPGFFTDDMRSRIDRGYDPLDAFELAHRDTLSAQSKKAAEQKLIKQQQLGIRSHVNDQTAAPADEHSLSPAQMALAEEFGVDFKGVQRQNQLIKSRR